MNNKTGSWDNIWEQVFKENPWGKYPSESLIRFIATNFYKSNRSEIKILEVGCGTGANIWYISREGFSAYGIDGSKTAIEIAKKRLEEENLHANLIVGDIIKLPYEDNFFDAVIDVECLYANNFENTKIILNEISRVLKKNGLFYSRTFSDEQYIGSNIKKNVENEYENIDDGPLKGKGFVRLSSLESIKTLYNIIKSSNFYGSFLFAKFEEKDSKLYFLGLLDLFEVRRQHDVLLEFTVFAVD
jgi:ubiquinone/menaquinone biosynthesis C-methylase UbiE